MKNERGEIKLITLVLIFLLIVALIVVFSVGIMMLRRVIKEECNEDNVVNNNNITNNTINDDKNVDNDGWKKVSVGEAYNDTTNIELDLDGDSIKEKIHIIRTGSYISINGKDYTANKYFDEDDPYQTEEFHAYSVNQYHFADLNDDGLVEIIHRTSSAMTLPSANDYTIYNFKDNDLKEIGSISIIGNIPDEIYVKGNTIKFEYWPFESPSDYTEEVILELNIDENVIYSTVYYFALGSRRVKIYDNGDVYDDIEIEDPRHVPNYEYVKTLSSNQVERFKRKNKYYN